MRFWEYLKLRWFLWQSHRQGFSQVEYDGIIYVCYWGKWILIGKTEEGDGA